MLLASYSLLSPLDDGFGDGYRFLILCFGNGSDFTGIARNGGIFGQYTGSTDRRWYGLSHFYEQ